MTISKVSKGNGLFSNTAALQKNNSVAPGVPYNDEAMLDELPRLMLLVKRTIDNPREPHLVDVTRKVAEVLRQDSLNPNHAAQEQFRWGKGASELLATIRKPHSLTM